MLEPSSNARYLSRVGEHVVPLDLGVIWEPNAPEATLLADDSGNAVLAQRAHFDDPDQRCVVLRFDGVLHAQLGSPNDEARHTHRLYEHGLRELSWAGVVHDSSKVDGLRSSWSRTTIGPDGTSLRLLPLHFVILSKECVVEVLAEDVDVERVEGNPAEAAVVSLPSSLSRMAVPPGEGPPLGQPDFTIRQSDLAAAIQLGYEAERDDPNIGFDAPPREEVEWLASWLVSEGWSRTS